jgi:hypothetical protein
MALLDIIIAAYIGVIITILIGIFIEGEKAQIDNVLSNLSSFFLLLATTNMSLQVVVGLCIYLALGIFIVVRKIKDLYTLFGAKTYGSISIVILFAESGYFGITFSDIRTVFMAIIVTATVVHIIGYIYGHRRKRSSGRKAGGKPAQGKKGGRGKGAAMGKKVSR